MISLFDPVQLGAVTLRNRVVMAPMTRTRAGEGRVPNELMRRYYSQRAEAGLILTEATAISPQGVGYPDTPGIWSRAQINGWKKITKAVHEKGGCIFMQLWHVGRVSDPEYLSGEIPVAPSAIPCDGEVSLLRPRRPYVTPRALHLEEIPGVVGDFTQGARNAKEAGFDGVEIHAASGYLIDQFLQDGTNRRRDCYGGSIPNRARLLLEIVDGCTGVWGADRVGVHLSPCNSAHSMSDSDPCALFSYVVRQLAQRNIAFLFVREAHTGPVHTASLKRIFNGKIIANDRHDIASAQEALEAGWADAIAFGKAFIANPDLVSRLRLGAELNVCDPATFYGQGPEGYIDYPALQVCALAAAEHCG